MSLTPQLPPQPSATRAIGIRNDRIITDTASLFSARPKPPRGLRLLAAMFVLALAGCASNHYFPADGPDAPVVIESDPSSGHAGAKIIQQPLDELLAQARNAHATTGAVPIALAASLIDAARREQRPDIADGIIASSANTQMTVDEYARFSLAALNYWNHTEQFDTAQRWLHAADLQNRLPMMAARDQIFLGMARADTLFGLQQYSASAMERIYLEDLLDDSAMRSANTQGIWRALLMLSPEQLRRQHRKAQNQSLRAWLELAMLQQDMSIDLDSQAAAVRQWQNRWPNHHANFQLPGSVQGLENIARNRPRTVGVFLPLTGELARAGKAIRDGIAAAHFGGTGGGASTPVLIFYDTSTQPIEALYARAQLDQVDLIIGPLHKDNVKALFTMQTDIPILTLNFIQDDLPPPLNIVQFGLAAEDEARQLADYAKRNEHKTVLLLHVNNGWAERAAAAFTEHWRELGGTKVQTQSLSSMENFSKEIANSLALDHSEARRTRLQNVLGQRLEFNPRRRQDIDLIVLLANSKQARAIKPLLAYHYAGKLPVIASSQVFDGKNGGSINRDLNGLIFSEMPWILDGHPDYSALPAAYSNSKSLSRLFAMGVDAYYLHGRLPQLANDPYAQIPAHTGRLSMQHNRIVRQLPLAKIEGGNAVRLD